MLQSIDVVLEKHLQYHVLPKVFSVFAGNVATIQDSLRKAVEVGSIISIFDVMKVCKKFFILFFHRDVVFLEVGQS